MPGATPQAAQLISNFEGFRADPYNDAQHGGNCTIGYGTLLHRGPCTAADTGAYPNGISRQDAQDLLQNDANAAANAIDHNVTVPLTEQQRDALTSFVYNVGPTAFQNSTLLRDINAGNGQAAADQLLTGSTRTGTSSRASRTGATPSAATSSTARPPARSRSATPAGPRPAPAPR